MMWKLCLAGLAALTLAGCAAPLKSESMVDYQRRQDAVMQKQQPTDVQQRQAAALRHQAEDIQALVDKRRLRLKSSTDAAERAELEKDLANMDQQLDRLQERLREDFGSARATPQAAASSTSSPRAYSPGGTYIGPRGGCYKLTRSGKKNYSAC